MAHRPGSRASGRFCEYVLVPRFRSQNADVSPQAIVRPPSVRKLPAALAWCAGNSNSSTDQSAALFARASGGWGLAGARVACPVAHGTTEGFLQYLGGLLLLLLLLLELYQRLYLGRG